MKSVDLHPEDLLDRELDGSIEDKDISRLESHRMQCSACDYEHQLMEDFNAKEQMQPTRQDEEMFLRLLDDFDRARPEPSKQKKIPPILIRFAVAAGILLITGVSAASLVSIVTNWLEEQETTEHNDEQERQIPNEDPPAHRRDRPRTERPIPQSKALHQAPDAEEDSHTQDNVSEPQQKLSRSEPPRRPDTPITRDDDVEPAQTSARELIHRANRARREQDYYLAVQLFRELERNHPGSREEISSRVTLGRLLLHQLNNPVGALRAFDRYLQAAPQGTLAQEALVGRALALGRLGHTDAERRAWSTLLERYSSSIHASRARRRLRELDSLH